MTTTNLVLLLTIGIPVFGYLVFAINAYFLTLIAQRIWAWIDDTKPSRHNWYVRAVMRLYGYKPRNEDSEYYEPINGGSSIDGADCFSVVTVIPFCIVLSVCLTILCFIFQPLILAILGICIAMIFSARFIRRLSKVVTKHVNDPDAHNKKD